MATKVAGEMYEIITGQLFEIGRQLRQKGGYPFNPEELKNHLQAGIEGRFVPAGINDLLEKIATVSVPGVDKFVAKEHIKSANIGWMGDKFKKLFLNKVEEGVKDIVARVDRLKRASCDGPIRAQLGDRGEVSLAHFFWLIEQQPKGENGKLLTNGYANIAYIRGIDNNLWAVSAFWHSDGGDWDVDAHSVGRPDWWRGGHQVLSRDSL